MSILIRGMEMPTNCMLCSFCVPEADEANGEMCMVTGKLMPPCNHERLDDCPLVSVSPHGRLIDADALLFECNTGRIRPWESFVTHTYVNDAPTIIEAEGRE